MANSNYTYILQEDDDVFDNRWDFPDSYEDYDDDLVEQFVEMRRLEFYEAWSQYLAEYGYYDDEQIHNKVSVKFF